MYIDYPFMERRNNIFELTNAPVQETYRLITGIDELYVQPTLYRVYPNALYHDNHHQPINVPTAGAQAFLIDHT
jgi:hypothetical protein